MEVYYDIGDPIQFERNGVKCVLTYQRLLTDKITSQRRVFVDDCLVKNRTHESMREGEFSSIEELNKMLDNGDAVVNGKERKTLCDHCGNAASETIDTLDLCEECYAEHINGGML